MAGSAATEWDETKRQSNLAKHGVDFAIAEKMDWDSALEATQVRDGEQRVLAYVLYGDRLHAAVYTMRAGARRIISLRKANNREIAYYEQETSQKQPGR